MPFGLWEANFPSTPVAAHLKQQSAVQTAVRTLLSNNGHTPESPSPSIASTSSTEWDSDDGYSTPGTSPESSPHCSNRFINRLPLQKTSEHKPAPPASLQDQLALSLTFSGSSTSNLTSETDAEETCSPPAFFPCQRIAFSPRLKISVQKGLKLEPSLIASASARLAAITRDEPSDALVEEALCSMSLSVTGVVEILTPSKQSSKSAVISSRLIADFCTDLSSGIKIWQRDAAQVINRKNESRKGKSSCKDPSRLPAGTYVLPLSIKIPASDQLPPSFESPHFRLRYTMTLALFSRRKTSGDIQVLKSFSTPFQILPSTLPSLPPALPILSHTSSSGFGAAAANLFSSVAKLVGSDPTKDSESQEWQVQTSLPTCSFSPSETVPVTLSIRSPISHEPPSVMQQIFVRLTLVRRIYVRESHQTAEQEFDWGLGLEALATDDAAWERYLREEAELCQRWGILTLPATSTQAAAKTTIRDIPLPLSALLGQEGGYSASLELSPGSGKPSLDQKSNSSWFSPAVIKCLKADNAKAWDKHVHVSARFYISVEVGFFASSPKANPTQSFELFSSVSPYAPRQNASSTSTAFKSQFPGKLRELLVPITLGSVAEPALACLEEPANTAEWAGEARGSTQPGDDVAETHVAGIAADCWVIPPPTFDEAIASPPSFESI